MITKSIIISLSFVIIIFASTTNEILKEVEQAGYPLNFKVSVQGQLGTDEEKFRNRGLVNIEGKSSTGF